MKEELIEQQSRADRIKQLIKDNAVLIIAFFGALITSFIIPPDKEYLGYFDLKTLSCLFCVLAVCAPFAISDFSTLWRRR